MLVFLNNILLLICAWLIRYTINECHIKFTFFTLLCIVLLLVQQINCGVKFIYFFSSVVNFMWISLIL